MYNPYQQMHYKSLYGSNREKKKEHEWKLMEGKSEVIKGNRALVEWKKKQMVANGSHAKLLKIIPA